MQVDYARAEWHIVGAIRGSVHGTLASNHEDVQLVQMCRGYGGTYLGRLSRSHPSGHGYFKAPKYALVVFDSVVKRYS